MKRFLLGLTLAAGFATASWALSSSSIPPKFNIPWGSNAGAAYIRSIPQSSQIGIVNCAASLTDGFPPLTFVPASAGGCPPFGQDFNGIFKQITQWAQWQAAGGPMVYDATFATNIGGYPSGARLASAVTPGLVWYSTADNNSTNPDTSTATNWVQDPGQVPIGTALQSFVTTPPTGYVSANGLTIGNASSNATNRANADTQFLFNFIWNNCSNTVCPIFTSGGSPSTRGATPWADFAANKAISVVPNMSGTGLMGADSQGGTTTTRLNNVPITTGNRTTTFSLLGENLHMLTVPELAQHNHAITDPGHTHGGSFASGGGVNNNAGGGGGAFGAFTGFSSVSSNTTGITTNNNGSNTPHNTVALSTVVYWNLKL